MGEYYFFSDFWERFFDGLQGRDSEEMMAFNRVGGCQRIWLVLVEWK